MKTQYFRKPRRFVSVRQALLLALLGGVFGIFLLIRLFAPDFLMVLAQPLLRTGDFLTSHVAQNESASVLASEGAVLRLENETLANENRALRARIFDEALSAEAGGVLAGVVARPPMAPYDVLIVGAGSVHGVYPSMRVFAKHIPVGMVESVSERSARITLFSAAGQVSEGWAGEARIPLTLVGEGAGAFTANIARESTLQEDDEVYLPGPGALPVGVIIKIESNASSPSAVVHIRPYANPFTMTMVTIVASPTP